MSFFFPSMHLCHVRSAVPVHNCVWCLYCLYIPENWWDTEQNLLAHLPAKMPAPLNAPLYLWFVFLKVTLWVQFCAIRSATVRACLTSVLLCITLRAQPCSFHIWLDSCCSWCCFSHWQTHASMVLFQSAAWLTLHHLCVKLNRP